MESNWRYFVPYTGLAGIGIPMLAMQRLSTPDVWGLIGGEINDGFVRQWLAGPDQLPTFFQGLPKLAPNFPYGYDVFPDSWFLEWPPP